MVWRNWSPALAGLLFSGGFLQTASRSGLRRYYAFAVLAVGLGVLLATQEFTVPYGGVRVWAPLMALASLSAGAWMLRRFLRDHPVIDSSGGPRTRLRRPTAVAISRRSPGTPGS